MSLLKATTRLTGLAVSLNPHKELSSIYKRTLDTVKKMPEAYSYRTETEKLVSERLNLVNKHTNVSDLEESIGAGQIEEVILQSKKEYDLARQMLLWKPWEPLVETPEQNQWKWPPV